MTSPSPSPTAPSRPPSWRVVCPECGDELYSFPTEDMAERMADVHADTRAHNPLVEESRHG